VFLKAVAKMFPVLFVFKYGHLVKSCLHFKFLIYIFLIFKVTIFRKKGTWKMFCFFVLHNYLHYQCIIFTFSFDLWNKHIYMITSVFVIKVKWSSLELFIISVNYAFSKYIKKNINSVWTNTCSSFHVCKFSQLFELFRLLRFFCNLSSNELFLEVHL